jgi:hypothetical protein
LMTIIIAISHLFQFFMSFFIASVSAFIMGLLLVIFSVAYLDKGKNRTTELFITGSRHKKGDKG